MLVSFIIPHKGREELLEQTIQSVLDLDVDLQEIEIIVVTQNKTLKGAIFNQNTVPLKTLFRPEHETISALRNRGSEHASGEYLVFLDADIQLSKDWLKTMFQELREKPGRILVSAMQQCRSHAGIIEKIRVTLNNSVADRVVQFLDGRNLFLARKTFDDVGGFPEHLVTCEDYYFTNRVHQRGEVYFTSKTSYIHLGEDKNYAELFKKEIWRGQSNLQSLKGRKLVLREIPSVIIPLWQAIFFVLAILSVFWGSMVWMLFAIVMFCFPIFLYALRLYRIDRRNIRFLEILLFYLVYFPARVIGTTLGIFKVIKV